MVIAVMASDRQWEELNIDPVKAEWIRVKDMLTFSQNERADAFINLQEDAALFNYSGLQRPVIINSVTKTLQQVQAPANVLRINGWNGFLQRQVWEVAGILDEKTSAVFNALNKKISPVKDEPGLIAARIIAMIINEAYFALGDNVSSKDDINTAMKLGTNYPYGPFEWAAIIGLPGILTLLQQLAVTDDRYRPATLLLTEATINNS